MTIDLLGNKEKNQTCQDWTAWSLMPKFKISASHNLKASVIFDNTLHNAVQWQENEKKKKPYRLVLTKSRHSGGWQLKEKFTLEPNYSDLFVLISLFSLNLVSTQQNYLHLATKNSISDSTAMLNLFSFCLDLYHCILHHQDLLSIWILHHNCSIFHLELALGGLLKRKKLKRKKLYFHTQHMFSWGQRNKSKLDLSRIFQNQNMNFSNTENFKLSNLWPFGCNSKH